MRMLRSFGIKVCKCIFGSEELIWHINWHITDVKNAINFSNWLIANDICGTSANIMVRMCVGQTSTGYPISASTASTNCMMSLKTCGKVISSLLGSHLLQPAPNLEWMGCCIYSKLHWSYLRQRSSCWFNREPLNQ